MTVKIDNESKKWMTLYELPIAKDITKDLKEEDIKSDVEIACHCIDPYGVVTVYSATAKIAGNQRVYNYYKDESGHLDVWIDFIAYINGETPMFVEAGAYLSDIWQAGPETYDEIRNHMHIRKFTEQ